MAGLVDFILDPQNFMQTNIVRVVTPPNPNAIPDNAPVRVTLHDTQKPASNIFGGKVFDLFIPNDVNAAGIDAYFCPYQDDQSFFITLGNAADYMFTPNMDGCTFGVGSQAAGVCRVGHVNFSYVQRDWYKSGRIAATTRMRNAQTAFLKNRLNVGDDRLIEPAVYQGPLQNFSATTFGVRGPNQVWSFSTLRYGQPGVNTFVHQGIHMHVNN